MKPNIGKDRTIEKAQLDILLVEDNPTDVLVVKSQLEEVPDFRLEAVEQLSSAIESLKLKTYDIILLDLNLPDSTGLEGLDKLRSRTTDVAVIVFTGVDNEQVGIMALQRGAQDYLVKGVDAGRLVRSMRYAIERMRAHTQQNQAEVLDHGESKPYEVLTEREMQVLKLLGKGFSNQEILETLGISLTTVKTHMSNIFQKLSVSDRTKAVVEAQQRRLI